MRELDARHGVHTELARRQYPTVPGQDAVVAVAQDRIGETELPDAPGDLRDLRLRVRPRVARVGDQRVDRPIFDRQFRQLRPPVRISRHYTRWPPPVSRTARRAAAIPPSP